MFSLTIEQAPIVNLPPEETKDAASYLMRATAWAMGSIGVVLAYMKAQTLMINAMLRNLRSLQLEVASLRVQNRDQESRLRVVEKENAELRHERDLIDLGLQKKGVQIADIIQRVEVPLTGRVLLVEDDRKVSGPFARILVEAGCDVTKAETVVEAINQLTLAKPFDVVLLDIRLPDGSGIDIHRMIRSSGIKSLVAYVTGEAPEVLATAAELRPDDVFRKPIDVGAVTEWIHKSVSQRQN